MSLNLVRARLCLMFNYDIEVFEEREFIQTKINIRTMQEKKNWIKVQRNVSEIKLKIFIQYFPYRNDFYLGFSIYLGRYLILLHSEKKLSLPTDVDKIIFILSNVFANAGFARN